MDILFYDKDHKGYGAVDVCSALKQIGAADCETLFIHSDIMFGRVPDGFNKKEYLWILYEILCGLGVKNLIVPTFTYSFCNHEDYDVHWSRSGMGALTEYIRKQEGRYRTLDPLLSFSVPIQLKSKFERPAGHSLGEGSGFDTLHRMDGVKFLFFGARQGECFTYVHYVEKMLDVPYRFDMPFSGHVIDHSGNVFPKVQYMHTHCQGVKIPASYDYFEDELVDKGLVRKKRLGDSFVSCLSQEDAYRQIVRKIEADPYFFVEGTYRESCLVYRYGFGQDGQRITHC